MSDLPALIYGPIAAALVATIGILWKVWADERTENKALYRELKKDTEALQAIARRMDGDDQERREHSDLLRLIATRLASLDEHLRRSPARSEGPTAA